MINTSSRPTDGHPVELRFEGLYRARPPKVILFLEVTLRNERDDPLWFILPDVPDMPASGAKAVSGVDVYHLGGTGRVIVAHATGNPGFFALKVAAKAEVRLTRFPMTLWSRVPDAIPVEVVMAGQLMIDGRPAQSWFGVDPTCSGKADVDASPLQDQAAVQHSTQAAVGARMAVTFVAAQRSILSVHLGEDAAPRSQ